MTVQEAVALLIANRVAVQMFEVNGAQLTLDVDRVQDDAVFLNVRVFASNEVEGKVIVPVVTVGCEHLDRYSPEGPVDT